MLGKNKYEYGIVMFCLIKRYQLNIIIIKPVFIKMADYEYLIYITIEI